MENLRREKEQVEKERLEFEILRNETLIRKENLDRKEKELNDMVGQEFYVLR